MSQKQNNTESNSTTQPSVEQYQASPRYVVLRDGYRVSDREYFSIEDESALIEQAFWGRIAKFFSWGEKVEIVEYDSRKHRTW